jgi:hypothetical protein
MKAKITTTDAPIPSHVARLEAFKPPVIFAALLTALVTLATVGWKTVGTGTPATFAAFV